MFRIANGKILTDSNREVGSIEIADTKYAAEIEALFGTESAVTELKAERYDDLVETARSLCETVKKACSAEARASALLSESAYDFASALDDAASEAESLLDDMERSKKEIDDL